VRLVDLAGPERLARPAKLGTGAENRRARPNGARQVTRPGGRRSTDLRRTETRPGREDNGARTKTATAWPHLRTDGQRRRNLDRVVIVDNILDGDDDIGALRNGSAGGDSHRLARAQRPIRRAPGGDPRDNWQPARDVRRANREAVHGRARKG